MGAGPARSQGQADPAPIVAVTSGKGRPSRSLSFSIWVTMPWLPPGGSGEPEVVSDGAGLAARERSCHPSVRPSEGFSCGGPGWGLARWDGVGWGGEGEGGGGRAGGGEGRQGWGGEGGESNGMVRRAPVCQAVVWAAVRPAWGLAAPPPRSSHRVVCGLWSVGSVGRSGSCRGRNCEC